MHDANQGTQTDFPAQILPEINLNNINSDMNLNLQANSNLTVDLTKIEEKESPNNT